MKQERNLSRNKRSPSPSFIIKKGPKKISAQISQPSSLNTSLQSNHNQYPEEGRLLNFIMEMEIEQEQSIFNLKLSSIALEDDSQQKLAISDDPNNSQLRRQLQYNKHYYQEYSNCLHVEHIFFGNSLQNQKISPSLRAKMVDWMIEVLSNYADSTTDATLFRAVSLMDFFLKKTNTQYSDHNLHLIGIGCMFIATKLEDIYHIPLSDFVNRIGHNKFSTSKIKGIEQTILETLNFDITFPTSLDYLQHLCYQCFSLNDDQNIQNIQDASIYILKMCLHDYSITNYDAKLLASSSLYYSICDFVGQNNYRNQEQILNQFNLKVIQISQITTNEFNQCQQKLKDLIIQYKEKYPDLQNLDKFS